MSYVSLLPLSILRNAHGDSCLLCWTWGFLPLRGGENRGWVGRDAAVGWCCPCSAWLLTWGIPPRSLPLPSGGSARERRWLPSAPWMLLALSALLPPSSSFCSSVTRIQETGSSLTAVPIVGGVTALWCCRLCQRHVHGIHPVVGHIGLRLSWSHWCLTLQSLNKPQAVHSVVNGRLACFQLLAIKVGIKPLWTSCPRSWVDTQLCWTHS